MLLLCRGLHRQCCSSDAGPRKIHKGRGLGEGQTGPQKNLVRAKDISRSGAWKYKKDGRGFSGFLASGLMAAYVFLLALTAMAAITSIVATATKAMEIISAVTIVDGAVPDGAARRRARAAGRGGARDVRMRWTPLRIPRRDRCAPGAGKRRRPSPERCPRPPTNSPSPELRSRGRRGCDRRRC